VLAAATFVWYMFWGYKANRTQTVKRRVR
jgi:hypothetical protein